MGKVRQPFEDCWTLDSTNGLYGPAALWINSHSNKAVHV